MPDLAERLDSELAKHVPGGYELSKRSGLEINGFDHSAYELRGLGHAVAFELPHRIAESAIEHALIVAVKAIQRKVLQDAVAAENERLP